MVPIMSATGCWHINYIPRIWLLSNTLGNTDDHSQLESITLILSTSVLPLMTTPNFLFAKITWVCIYVYMCVCKCMYVYTHTYTYNMNIHTYNMYISTPRLSCSHCNSDKNRKGTYTEGREHLSTEEIECMELAFIIS